MQEQSYGYFACANSCRGFVDFFPSILEGLDRIFILKGGPGTGKSTLMRELGSYFGDAGESVEYIYCSSDTSSLDGVILRNRGIAVVDGTAPHVIEPTVPGACEEYVNLGIAWDREKLVPYRREMQTLKKQITAEYQQMYQILGEAKQVHDRWEKFYAEHLDYEKLNQVTQQLEERILTGILPKGEKGKAIHRFFGAMTPEGSVHFIEELTEGLPSRYFIKGRPGTGKSTLMKKLAKDAAELGLAVIVYHCSFDTESLDMVILDELGVCVFDATQPHELFPSRAGDVIVDLYASAVEPETDERFADTLSLIAGEYARCMTQARSHLARVHHLHDALEEYYIHAVDFKKVTQMLEDIIQEIE